MKLIFYVASRKFAEGVFRWWLTFFLPQIKELVAGMRHFVLVMSLPHGDNHVISLRAKFMFKNELLKKIFLTA